MKLLNFQMPPFARIQYVTQEIKEMWEPRVAKAMKAYYDLEILTVQAGIRACTTRHIPPQNLEAEMAKFARMGLYWLPITRVGAYSGFAHTHPPVIEGRPWTFYGVVSNSLESALAFVDASNNLNHDTLGKLLGYPDCCREFFDKVWGAGYVDPIWQQAMNAHGTTARVESSIEDDKPDSYKVIHLTNDVSHMAVSMLRYIGVRAVPHIPCSMDCEHTKEIARQWIGLGFEKDVEGIDDLVKLLTLPTEWDCLKGVAVVSTPLFKISTNSVTCFPRHLVRKEGTWYPEEAPSGLKFPWETKTGFGCNTSIRTHAKSDLIQLESV